MHLQRGGEGDGENLRGRSSSNKRSLLPSRGGGEGSNSGGAEMRQEGGICLPSKGNVFFQEGSTFLKKGSSGHGNGKRERVLTRKKIPYFSSHLKGKAPSLISGKEETKEAAE